MHVEATTAEESDAEYVGLEDMAGLLGFDEEEEDEEDVIVWSRYGGGGGGRYI